MKQNYTFGTLQSCNVSYNEELTLQEILDIFNNKKPISNWLSHFYSFFAETPTDFIQGFMTENNINKEQLKNIFIQLPAVYHTQKTKSNFEAIYNG